jgi:methylated-DNA-[protein]-cysteine S-methyltransferase
MKTIQHAAERFAGATDALITGMDQRLSEAGPFAGELVLAARLRAGAAAGIPDPAFTDGLRRELRARAAMRGLCAGTDTLRYAVMETLLGKLALAYRNGHIVSCARIDEEGEAAFVRSVAGALGVVPAREDAPPPAIARGVREHLAGKRTFTAFDLSWLKPFHRRVLEKTVEIPRGEVRPYGWIAREIGAPGATRAVGTALGRNPIPFLIPCHRVVRADGSLGEYSGGGPAMKVKVLELEGAPIDVLLSAPSRGERYRASRTTHIVCYPTCHAARRIRPENAVPFASLSDARAAGYRPCELCRPA